MNIKQKEERKKKKPQRKDKKLKKINISWTLEKTCFLTLRCFLKGAKAKSKSFRSHKIGQP